ncbi:MAG: transglutaminase-like domain-containing protein [Planctomycetota bacterium]|jgi:hypothetical protein
MSKAELAAVLALSTLVFVSAAPGLEPEVRDRADDAASLALHLKGKTDSLREEYSKALVEAGDNRFEIEKALKRASTRREKLLTIWFLAKLRGKSFMKLEGEDWTAEADLQTLTGELVGNNIRYALAARDRFPWCRRLDWSTFLRHVLPHRGSQEKAEDFRPRLWKELAPQVEDASGASDALRIVREWISKKVNYERRGGQDQGVLETLEKGKGGREDLANFASACAVTVGIPCTSAYTPWWAAKDGNHIWNEARVGGTWVPFSAERAGPEEGPFTGLPGKTVMAKVYRKSFSTPNEDEEAFGIDVTRAYTRTKEILLEVETPSVPVRLAVWNTYGWRVVAASKSDGEGRVRFPDVGCSETTLFMAYYEGANAEAAAGPLLFHPGGRIEMLKVDPVVRGSQDLEPVVIGGFMPDASYAVLAFVGKEWSALSRSTSPFTGRLDLGRVGREKTLYLLVRIYGERSIPEGRPFLLTFEDGKAVQKKY